MQKPLKPGLICIIEKGSNNIINKTELINTIAENASLAKKDAGAALDATIKTITYTLSKGEDVVL